MTFDWLKDNGIFMPMINDTGRNIFYKQAIESTVNGKVVVDVGTGTGLLSVLAAKAGAAKIYSIEIDKNRAEYAREIFRDIGLTNIEVINDDFLNTNIPADIYISETIGSQIFNENIIGISQHARKLGGRFIPETFELHAKVFENHPIFPLVQARSEAFEFQPDIEIDSNFEHIVNTGFQQNHGFDQTLYRANCIYNLFAQLHKFTDLRLNTIYQTPATVVDLNAPIDNDNIKIVIPYEQVRYHLEHGIPVCVVLFWTATCGPVRLDVNTTIWGNPNKIILPKIAKGIDITMWYDEQIKDWRLSY